MVVGVVGVVVVVAAGVVVVVVVVVRGGGGGAGGGAAVAVAVAVKPGWMDVHACTDGWMDGWTGGWVDVRIRAGVLMHGRREGGGEGLMDGWTNTLDLCLNRCGQEEISEDACAHISRHPRSQLLRQALINLPDVA